MNIQEMERWLKSKQAAIENLYNRVLPVRVGNIALNHYRGNFNKGGFDGTPWAKTKRQLSGDSSAGANYTPLLSGRNHLRDNTKYETGKGFVVVYNQTEYAQIHNEGGTVRPKVTPAMRKFAWRKFFEGKKVGNMLEANKWKGLALTKKTELAIVIPKRQFLAESKPLNAKVRELIISETVVD